MRLQIQNVSKTYPNGGRRPPRATSPVTRGRLAFWTVLRFELDVQLRQRSTWVYAALLFALALLRADATDVDVVHYHAPTHAAWSSLLVGVFATLVTAGLFVEAGQRDERWRIAPLVSTTPLSPWVYLGGRFLGPLLINAALLFIVPVTLMLGPSLLGLNPEKLGPLRVGAYGTAYLVFLLPPLLVNAAVLFGVTVLTRRALPGYLGALGLVALYLFTGLGAGADSSGLVAMLDPTGAAALSQVTGDWTRAELNAAPVGLGGVLLWNRLLWSALALGALTATVWRSRLPHAELGSRRRAGTTDAEPDPVAVARGGTEPVPAAPRAYGWRTVVRQTLSVARLEFRQTVSSRDALLVALGLFVFGLLLVLAGPSSVGTPLWPLTQEVVEDLTGQVVRVLIALLTAFYAGEVVWRERDAGLEKIGDSTPVPDVVPVVGKLLALGGLLAVFQAVLMASGMVGQVVQGYTAFEPSLYLLVLFGLQLPEYLLFGVLALLVHVLVDHKYLGHLVVMLLFIATLQAKQFGIEHNLWVYGSDAGWIYSSLNGLGPSAAPFVWFKLYWAAWALVLGVVALLFWARGAEVGLRRRVRLARQRVTPGVAVSAVAAVLLVVATGGFVFYNTNVLNEYRTGREVEERHAEYERRYKRFEHAEQPLLTDIRLHAELYPERREATMRSTYWLVNRTGEPIDSVHLSSLPEPGVALRGVRFDRSARPVLEDAEHGYRIYALRRALQPGDTLRMHAEVDVTLRGFRNREELSRDRAMIGAYTSLGSRLLPKIGYQVGDELSAADARREHGLPPSDVRPSIHDPQARQAPRIPRVGFEGTVGTPANHTAVMPGTLQRSWTEGDRRYAHYRSEAPILNFFSVLSSEFAEHRAQWAPASSGGRAVEVRVLHHPDHRFNVERTVSNVQESLDAYTETFGPYPYRQLTMVEFPRYGNGALAYGGLILYTERHPITLARMAGGPAAPPDEPLQVTAHEVAHQWWGQQVMGANVQGSQALSETLAQYSSAVVLERTHGAGHVRQFLRRMQIRYLNGRGHHETPEAPLLLTTDHAYIHYGKGAVVLYALRDYVGADGVDAALRRLVQRYGMEGPPYPTSLDLYRELRSATPDSLQTLLDDLVATITLWDIKTAAARAEPTGEGAWRVTIDVEAAKVRSDRVGNEVEVPMDDWVEVGVFGPADAGEMLGEPLYLAKHRVRTGRQTITVTVNRRPARAGVDPDHLLISRYRELLDEKVRAVETGPPSQ